MENVDVAGETGTELLVDSPAGIGASAVFLARIIRNADEAHTLVEAMETDGQLRGRD